MAFKFNPFTGIFDIVNTELPELGGKFKMHMNALAAYDRVQSISYLDLGERNQRIQNATLSSSAYPDANILVDVFHADVGTINQRITKFEISGPALLPDKVRKNFLYSSSGDKIVYTGYNYELF